MSLPGKARQFPFLAITTLSIAAVGVTAPAWAPKALANAGQAAVTSGARPAVNSAVAGYVLSGDGTGYYTFDSADSAASAVTVTPIGAGVFKVIFAKLSSIAGTAAPQVTAFNAADNCVLNIPTPAAGDLQVIVQCTRVATGNPDADAEFDLLVTRPVHPVHGTFDYSVVTKLRGTMKQHQYNSAGKPNTVEHLGTGIFQVILGGPKTTGRRGIVKVSSLQPSNGGCQLMGWQGFADGVVVDVNCYNYPHTLADRHFVVTYATASSLMGSNNQVAANAFAADSAPVYQPAVQYDSAHGAKVTIVHYQTGSYEVLPAGSAGNVAKFGGDVQVSAVGNKGQFCITNGWSQQLTPSISVACYDKNGVLTDAPFTMAWVVP
ncbi:MAG TPA: hypothetical protein VFI65_06190 [Streptosporangiaceae bacterium]|nr:hypothetical protein [Streptosporangiaceae bacterium]